MLGLLRQFECRLRVALIVGLVEHRPACGLMVKCHVGKSSGNEYRYTIQRNSLSY